jgi:hypothetical protein
MQAAVYPQAIGENNLLNSILKTKGYGKRLSKTI